MKTLIGILFAFSLTAATPDCMKQYHFSNRSGDVGGYGQEFVAITTAGNNTTASYNNTIYQCNSWLVSYSSEGLSGLSLQFEDAPNTYSSGNTAGTFVAFAGTAFSGSNPMSTTTSNYYSGVGYYPWLRMNLVSKTGTGSIDVVMQGWKSPVFIGSILNGSACSGDLSGTFPSCTIAKVSGGGASWSVNGLGGSYWGNVVSNVGCQIAYYRNGIQCGPQAPFAWSSDSAGAGATVDTGESRISSGIIGAGNGTTGDVTGFYEAAKFITATNCSSAAAPAVCASAAAGSVVVPAAGTTVTVNTTAVTANSQIFLTFDASLSTKLSVTCNSTEPALYGITARTAATSFVITSSAPVTNPACFSYFIVN